MESRNRMMAKMFCVLVVGGGVAIEDGSRRKAALPLLSASISAASGSSMATTSYFDSNKSLIPDSTLGYTCSRSPRRFPRKSIPPMMSSFGTISVTQNVSAPKTFSFICLQSSLLTFFSRASGFNKSTRFSNSFVRVSLEDPFPPDFTSPTIFAICSAALLTLSASSSVNVSPPRARSASAIFAMSSGSKSIFIGPSFCSDCSARSAGSSSSSSMPKTASRSSSVRFIALSPSFLSPPSPRP
mmetsp:Transcript_15872/g.40472  ORF Transcript_15872/g.40472 Transcript_15872/m.40472 type:complete len:242 (-) Transcript_15872:209-934(-)